MRVLDRLHQEGHIADDQYQAAIVRARGSGDRMEEAILAVGAISEQQLLKTMAGWYRTQFVGTEKLAKADIDRALLQLVPRRVALRLHVFPVRYKRVSQQLAVVASDPSDPDIAKQVQMVAQVRTVSVLVARPSAVDAMIAKHYDDDPRVLASLVRRLQMQVPTAATGPEPGLDVGGGGFSPFDGFIPSASAQRRAPKPAPKPEIVISAPEIAADLAESVPPPPPTSARPQRRGTPIGGLSGIPPAVAGSIPPGGIDEETHLEMIQVLVALLERERGALRGHSSRVAKLARQLAERIGLSGRDLYGVTLAGHLHDVGKASLYHLTAVNVARYEGHRLQAQKSYAAPLRLFESANLPDATKSALEHLYERWDGEGFPGRLKGTHIPMPARIVAVAETYLDLTTHDKNPYRRMLSAAEAVDVIRQFGGTIFDPTVCSALRQVVGGDDLRRKLAGRRTVLLVDPDPEETAVLDLRFADAGFDVRLARGAPEALNALEESTCDVVVSEVDLASPDDGFLLIAEMRAAGHEQPFVFLTRRGNRDSVDRGFSAGAVDYVVKPASPDLLVAKVRQLLERASKPRGVSGSLAEMSLPDVVQILANGRRSGRLVVRGVRGGGGEIHFHEGQIWDARCEGKTGEIAVYALLRLQDGEFQLEPGFKPGEQKIHAGVESLLLEGMRRLDEGL